MKLFFSLILSSTETLVRNLEISLIEKRPELILVFTLGSLTKSILSGIDKIFYSQLSWVFCYKSQGHTIIEALKHELREFNQINLNSRWYALTVDDFNQNVEFYELYKKSKGSNLTISQLCSSKIKLCPKPEFIWKRRKDLSGVHFQVAAKRGDTLLKNFNEVCKISICQHSTTFYLQHV
jgi:hypothetical protein